MVPVCPAASEVMSAIPNTMQGSWCCNGSGKLITSGLTPVRGMTVLLQAPPGWPGAYLGVVHQVAGLQRVREGHPGQVAEGQHEAEAVGGDVHGGQDGGLVPQRVRHVQPVEGAHERHGRADAPVQLRPPQAVRLGCG